MSVKQLVRPSDERQGPSQLHGHGPLLLGDAALSTKPWSSCPRFLGPHSRRSLWKGCFLRWTTNACFLHACDKFCWSLQLTDSHLSLDYCRRLSILSRVILTLVESHWNLEWELHCGTSKRRSRALSTVIRWAVSSLLSHRDRSCPHPRQGRQLQSKSLRPRPLHGNIWRMPSLGKRRRTGQCKSAQRTPRERKTPLHPTQSHSHPHSQRLLREGTRCVHPSQPLWHQGSLDFFNL